MAAKHTLGRLSVPEILGDVLRRSPVLSCRMQKAQIRRRRACPALQCQRATAAESDAAHWEVVEWGVVRRPQPSPEERSARVSFPSNATCPYT